MPTPKLIRRIGAVLAGLFVVFILSYGTDQAMHSTGVFPPFGQPMADAFFVLAAAYRAVYGIVGSYITARLTPVRPLQGALALGFVGLAISIAGTAATWNEGSAFGPKWYALVVIAMALPCAWAGGKLREMQLRKKALD